MPLRSPDADVPLDLGEALTAIYEEAAYELSIDYHQAPPPLTLSKADIQWLSDNRFEFNLENGVLQLVPLTNATSEQLAPYPFPLPADFEQLGAVE